MALVEGGNIREGWPGAPGCTTTGPGFVSTCCARTEKDNKQIKAAKAENDPRAAVEPNDEFVITRIVNKKKRIDLIRRDIEGTL